MLTSEWEYGNGKTGKQERYNLLLDRHETKEKSKNMSMVGFNHDYLTIRTNTLMEYYVSIVHSLKTSL